MKLKDRELVILQAIDKQAKIRQKELLKTINAPADKIVLQDIEKLSDRNIIFKYKLNGNRFHELAPNHTFYKNLEKQTKCRIDDLNTLLEIIKKNYVKYGFSVLKNIEQNFSLRDLNPAYFKNDVRSSIDNVKLFIEMSKHREKIIKKMHMMNNVSDMLVKEAKTAHQNCIKLNKKRTVMINKRNKMHVSDKKLLLDKDIYSILEEYSKQHVKFYAYEKNLNIHVKYNYDQFDIQHTKKHSPNHKFDYDKPLNKINNFQYCERCEQILNIIKKHDVISNIFIIDILNEHQQSMSPRTITKHIGDLVKEGKIHASKQGRRIVYREKIDVELIKSKKQIEEKIKEWKNALTRIDHKLTTYDISTQRDILTFLNKYFEHFQHIVSVRFKKYDDHNEMENQEVIISEIFNTIRKKTHIVKLFENMHSKRMQISDILFLIRKIPEKIFLSNEQIPKSLNANLIKLEQNKNELKELYDKKIEFTDQKTRKIFDDLFVHVDNVIDIILKKPIENLDEFYKIFRDTDELLYNMPYKDTHLYDVENNLIMIKTTLIKEHIDYDEI